MARVHLAGVLLMSAAAFVVSGCEEEASGTPAERTTARAPLSQVDLAEVDQAQAAKAPASRSAEPTAPKKRLSPEWTLQASGPYAFDKKGHSAAYTYLDNALHMRLLYQPESGGFRQGLTFHLPGIAYGQQGRVEAAFAKATFKDEGLRCSTSDDETFFAVEVERFTKDVRVGRFEGRLRCKADKEAERDEEDPKYVEVSGRFQHD